MMSAGRQLQNQFTVIITTHTDSAINLMDVICVRRNKQTRGLNRHVTTHTGDNMNVMYVGMNVIGYQSCGKLPVMPVKP
jgi:hypothetical protein